MSSGQHQLGDGATLSIFAGDANRVVTLTGLGGAGHSSAAGTKDVGVVGVVDLCVVHTRIIARRTVQCQVFRKRKSPTFRVEGLLYDLGSVERIGLIVNRASNPLPISRPTSRMQRGQLRPRRHQRGSHHQHKTILVHPHSAKPKPARTNQPSRRTLWIPMLLQVRTSLHPSETLDCREVVLASRPIHDLSVLDLRLGR